MLNIKSFIEGIRNYKYLVTSVKESFTLGLFSIKAKYRQKKVLKDLKNNLGVSLKSVTSNYLLIGNYHLEIFPHHGVFLVHSPSLADLYPTTIGIDTDYLSLHDTEASLLGTFCGFSGYILDISKEPLLSEQKFMSISLNFALDKIPGEIKEIENFLLQLKSMLYGAGTIFGITAPGIGLHYKPKHLQYMEIQYKNNIWFNKNISVNNLRTIFEKHFSNFVIQEYNSYITFALFVEVKKDVRAHKLDINNIEGKYLRL
ncbi:hypothetical protein ABSA28_00751 [Candidatus Hepatincolaceae symbiont of Richtersius coronifer]